MHTTSTNTIGVGTVDDVERSDDTFRAWMRGHQARAAATFGVTVTGDGVWGWCLRSLGAPARTSEGRRCWLRVGTERTADVRDPAVGAFWTGIPDSTAIVGVPKPDVLASMEWAEPVQGRMVRADLTTLLPGRPCSATDTLRTTLDLSDEWWTGLRDSVDRITVTPTGRYAHRVQAAGRSHVREVFGDRIADAAAPVRWATAHGDLHWANLLCGPLGMLDWELWGCAPAGADAATLYTFSLLVPEVAARVREVFADQLDVGTQQGRCVRLRAAARVLWRSRDGWYPGLAEAVRRDVRPVINTR